MATNTPTQTRSTDRPLPSAPEGDFAAGQRTLPLLVQGPDFARGQRTRPAAQAVADFATGQRTLRPAPEGPDFARGQRALPAPGAPARRSAA
jgi:hypothetical protein